MNGALFYYSVTKGVICPGDELLFRRSAICFFLLFCPALCAEMQVQTCDKARDQSAEPFR